MIHSRLRKFALPSLVLAGGLLGVSVPAVSSSAATKTVKIAFFGALTGPNAQLGINMIDGAKVAVAAYNKTAKVKVVLSGLDSQGDPAQAPQLAQKAATSGIVAIIGPAFSGESLQADPIFESAHIVSVTPSATNPTLATQGWKYWHRIVGNDNAQGPAAAQLIVKHLKLKQVYVINDASSYGQALAGIVATSVKSDGGTAIANDTLNATTASNAQYTSEATTVVSSKANAVFYGGYYAGGAELLAQLRTAGFKGVFVSDDGSLDPHLISQAGGPSITGSNTYATCACGDVSTSKAGKAFIKAFVKLNKIQPGTYSAEAYDAANVILAAIKAGKTTGPAINSYLASHTFAGITKSIKFTSAGDITGGGIFAYQASGSNFKSLGLVSSLM